MHVGTIIILACTICQLMGDARLTNHKLYSNTCTCTVYILLQFPFVLLHLTTYIHFTTAYKEAQYIYM